MPEPAWRDAVGTCGLLEPLGTLDARLTRSVDAVVVAYRSETVLDACLASVVRAGAETLRSLTVVDNDASGAGAAATALLAARRGARRLPLAANVGFGAAANRAVATGDAPFVLLLNPDTIVDEGAVAALLDAVRADARLAVVGPEVRNPDGSVYPSARAFPSLATAVVHAFVGLVAPRNRWSARYERPVTAEWVSGTAMLLRRSAFEAVGGFDEGYFMYVEDVDLCWRLSRQGWRVGVAPAACVTHHIGVSSDAHPYRMVVEHHRSLWRFARRTTGGASRLALPVVAAGLCVRGGLALVWRALAGRPLARRPAASADD